MNIDLHIERLILDGIDISHHERPVLQAGVTAELTRLLTEGGLQPGLTAGGAMAFARGDDIQMNPGGDPEQLGQQIAQSIYSGIGDKEDECTSDRSTANNKAYGYPGNAWLVAALYGYTGMR